MENFNLPTGFTPRKTEDLATISYIGYSKIGTLETSAPWVVQKIETVGDVSTISFGEGSWNNRATLNYK